MILKNCNNFNQKFVYTFIPAAYFSFNFSNVLNLSKFNYNYVYRNLCANLAQTIFEIKIFLFNLLNLFLSAHIGKMVEHKQKATKDMNATETCPNTNFLFWG